MLNKRLTRIAMFILVILLTSSFAYADSSKVVTLGKNLNSSQRTQILEIFNVTEKDADIIEINNEEERKYLEGIASEAQLGTKTMSSAYVELLSDGEGIIVETYNISWVTKEMYQNALITAGVTDAKVIAAAPFPVSGTGALTGVIKAFEYATGTTISEEQKKVANEEVVTSGELGEALGSDVAGQLIRLVKEKIITENIKSNEDILRVIVDVSLDLNINLTASQIESISKLMEKISKLDIDKEQVKNQLKNIGEKLNAVAKNEDVQNLFQKIWSALKEFFVAILSKK